MELYPLAYTQVDWRIFNDVCQRHLGVSPSRGIDGCYLDLEDPASFAGSVDMENQPLEALREHVGLAHSFISFLAVIDEDGLRQLHGVSIRVLSKAHSKYSYLAVLSGTIDEWYRSIIRGMRRDSPKELRALMTMAHSFLCQTGFREIFTQHTKKDLGDGTAILV